MGDRSASFAGTVGADTSQQRIVVVPPFFVDAREATVSDFAGSTTGVFLWSGVDAGTDVTDWCSSGSTPARASLPMNCVTRAAAQQFCEKKGSDLPHEVQLEYLESGMNGSLYVWGDDDPSCDDAVFGRDGLGIDFNLGSTQCRRAQDFGGPLSPTRDHGGARDVLTVGGQSIYDLAGNMAEWVLDSFEPQGGDCWPAGVLHDPICTSGSGQVARGGSWRDAPEGLRAAARRVVPTSLPPDLIGIGVRCAREGGR